MQADWLSFFEYNASEENPEEDGVSTVIRSVLALGAHPDDETILAGGTLALLSSQGTVVHLRSATRGEGGEVGDPPLCARPDVGRLREHELREAGRALGAASVGVLGYVDPLAGEDDVLYPFEADFDELAGRVLAAISETRADVVLTHGRDGEYGHPAHRLLHRAVQAAVEALGTPVLMYSWAARVPRIADHLWNESDPAHLALDVRPWLDAKAQAALAHRSQNQLFLRRHPGKTLREALRTVEAFHRHFPRCENGSPHDAFADLLRAAGAWEPAPRG